MRKYIDHRIVGTSRIDIDQKLIQPASLTPDRAYMQSQMANHIKLIDDNGVKDLSSFVQTLHDYGFKSNDYLNFINYCCEQLNLKLLKKRELKKSNAGEKNVLLNVLALQFPDSFNCLIVYFVNDKFPQMLNKDALFQDFKLKTAQLLAQNERNKVSVIQNIESTSLQDQSLISIDNSNQEDLFEVDQLDEEPFDLIWEFFE